MNDSATPRGAIETSGENHKKCFVISPIGAEGSEIREHADDVLECIIKPAMKQLNITAVRADEMDDSGKITDQMIRAILTYDICIVVLTDLNPNVFYELAIAQAAGRPVLLLVSADEKRIPFDIRDYRRISYDLKPQNVFTGKFINDVIRSCQRLLDPNYSPPKLIPGSEIKGNNGAPYWISGTSKEFGAPPKYISIVQEADKFCDLMGISLKSSWGRREGKEILCEKASQGIKVRILIMHEDNPGMGALLNNDLPGISLEDIQHEVKSMADHFWKMSSENENITVRQMRKGLPHYQLLTTDKTILSLQYMFSRGSAESPLLQFPPDTQLYKIYREEFDDLWNYNKSEVISVIKAT